MKYLSLVIPCYNEFEKLPNTTLKIAQYMDTLQDVSYELIIVNDGSKNISNDELLKINKECSKLLTTHTNNTNFEITGYPNNKGKGYAVKTGIKVSQYDHIIFMDCDLSTDLSAIKTVFDNIDNYKVIIGSRKIKGTKLVKKQGIIRKIIGIGCSMLTNLIIPLHIIDTQCGFKYFHKDIAKEIVERQIINRFAFDVEYLYIAKLNNFKIKEIPIIWENDEDSKVSVAASSVEFFKSLFKIRANKKNYIFKQ